MARHANIDWTLPENLQTWDQVVVAVLMDVRNELRRLNSVLHCPNFLAIPHKLDKIQRNTKRKKRNAIRKKGRARKAR